jgi:hypothetical protein
MIAGSEGVSPELSAKLGNGLEVVFLSQTKRNVCGRPWLHVLNSSLLLLNNLRGFVGEACTPTYRLRQIDVCNEKRAQLTVSKGLHG